MHREHDPYLVAQIAATLLSGRHDAEPHHIRAAVATARVLLDEVEPPEQPADEPEDTAAPDAKDQQGAGAAGDNGAA